MIAFRHQMHIEVAEHGRKAVGIVDIGHRALVSDTQAIGERRITGDRAGKQAGIVGVGERARDRAVCAQHVDR